MRPSLGYVGLLPTAAGLCTGNVVLVALGLAFLLRWQRLHVMAGHGGRRGPAAPKR